MILDDVFERFADQSPVSVMVRATLENALNPRPSTNSSRTRPDRQYTRTLLFSSTWT